MGVLATRSTFRPNPIGMSVVPLNSVSVLNGTVTLQIGTHDFLDKTPVIDIKPYIPYADAIPAANGGIAQAAPTLLNVEFNAHSIADLALYHDRHNDLESFIRQVLAQDPRPAYKKLKEDNKYYGMQLFDLNIRWSMKDLTTIEVTGIEEIK